MQNVVRLVTAVVLVVMPGCARQSPTLPDTRSDLGLNTRASASTAVSTNAMASQAALGVVASVASTNGRGGVMPAYYDGQQFTINFKELSSGGEGATLDHNGSINVIYMSDDCMPGKQMFVSVLDAIQGDGFNPLWNEVQVQFTPPSGCHQLTSDTEILAAAAAGQVRLVPTDEVYRCSVVGPKH